MKISFKMGVLNEKRCKKDIITILAIIKNPNKYYIKTYTEKNIKAVNLIENLPTIFP